ncbi:Putative DNA-binding domain-containing protein [Pseudomonas sp. LAMO17WK12:I6]|uniref:HvfC/BufC N-terminal domain-containing protein n=1 Tax=unclassified Pseudomonas TaxID=196821 RepID=UPI000BDC8308|nr:MULTISPECIES: DNA-binding domain-containing protein [unclassified Pseudomonas]SNY05413.1 Putative DNA-binding domain-containing protein [Pseudomonas sp. LAMO17WK12:I5]SNY05459.1 Putative DNA-binding domain-containing protein [Pseudomonas sp. LAMO17WK12:I6]
MSTQADFSAALLDTRLPCPAGLCSANGADPASRFSVYRNNVQGSLINALADSYPVVQQLVGEEFFRGMAGIFIQQQPPHSPLMSRYGDGLADFIDAFEAAAEVPYLADVARLERLRTRAYHAADAATVSAQQISAALADPQTLAELDIPLHPSLHLLDSAYAVVSIWAAHQGEATLAGIDIHQGQHALVLRNTLEVEVFALDHGASVFIRHLLNHRPLLQAAQDSPPFDLPQTLALLIGHNAITDLNTKVSP